MTDDALLPRADRWAVRLERHLDHPVDRVWRAVTDPGHVAQWFPAPIEGDLRPGGTLRFGDEPEPSGEVLAVEAPHHLAFTWGGDELHLDLAADGDGTRLLLVHVFDDKPGAASYATGWDQCLAALTAVAAGEPLPPADRGVARHEQLAARFGLGEPTVTGDRGTWTVRFERQLVCPADVARDLLTDVGPTDPDAHVDLVDGTGHGARLVVTVTGSADRSDARDAAAARWRAVVDHVAAQAARDATPV